MSQFGNLPEVVIYTEFGVEHKALVIGARSLEHHDGANEEPLLSLVFVKPVPDPTDPEHKRTLQVAGTAREAELVNIVHDVAHESHGFTPEQLDSMHKQGITASQVYPGGQMPGGRWKEIAQPVAAVSAEPEDQNEETTAIQ